jgi:hypothetical protein
LFISILSAASCGQPLQESVVPRGARIVRRAVAIDVGCWGATTKEKNLESGAAVVKLKMKNFSLD